MTNAFQTAHTSGGVRNKKASSNANQFLNAPIPSLESLPTTIQLQSSSMVDEIKPESQLPRRLVYFTLWTGLLAYAILYAPGGTPEAGAIDDAIIKNMISRPFDGTYTPYFSAVFNLIGVYPLIFASLLLPGAKLQKAPALPFVLSSFALGFFGLGPYMILREKKNDIVRDMNRGLGSAIFEFKGTTLLLIGAVGYLFYFAATGAFAGDKLQAYLDLFSSSRLAHVSTLDFTILSMIISDPISEDMKRRNWKGPPAAAFAIIPLFGPLLYLLIRPGLPKLWSLNNLSKPRW